MELYPLDFFRNDFLKRFSLSNQGAWQAQVERLLHRLVHLEQHELVIEVSNSFRSILIIFFKELMIRLKSRQDVEQPLLVREIGAV